jgi:BirA family biotin operon repressor/biotin-[acetyl-CoA-carboxylase] ligase
VYDDLDRPPLRAAALDRALRPDGWRVEVLASTHSTNAVVGARARDGAAPGLVVVAELQSAGRGRLDRTWISPARAGLTFSVLLQPADRAWVTLHAGSAVALALQDVAELDAVLKWPNDVLVGGRKIAGLLAEASVEGRVVLGVGLNVTTRADELPGDGTTSLRLAGAATDDRATLLKAVLRRLRPACGSAEDARATYRGLCSTIGQRVRLELPGNRFMEGTADGVDEAGRLLVDGTAYAAGDVVHLRGR